MGVSTGGLTREAVVGLAETMTSSIRRGLTSENSQAQAPAADTQTPVE